MCLTFHMYLTARARRVSYFSYVYNSSRKACVLLCICPGVRRNRYVWLMDRYGRVEPGELESADRLELKVS